MDFDWLNDDNDIIDSLVRIASLPEQNNQPTIPPNNSNVGVDILQYLLQQDNTMQHSMFDPTMNNEQLFQQIPQQQGPKKLSPEQVNQVVEKLGKIDASETNGPIPKLSEEEISAVFQQPISIVQGKDNFVTFTPASEKNKDSKKKLPSTKKVKHREPIFVTESPQSFNKKMKKTPNTTNNVQSTSSAEEVSDEEPDEELFPNTNSSSSSNLKQMTSKERRQLRNKISARNFRVRRKEYITQLEEKVEQQEKTIQALKEENTKLRKANEDIMKQVLNQPITPPSSSGDESNASSSGSEGHHSPDAVPSMFQFQLNDFYDVSLFDQSPPQPQQPMSDSTNAFFLNHAVMPDWDIHQVLGEKGRPTTTEEYQRELSKELFANYPLLAPALMSIVLRHTLSLEYVNSIAKEFTENMELKRQLTRAEDEETLRGNDDLDDLKAGMQSLHIEDIKGKQPVKDEKEEQNEQELTDETLMKLMLQECFSNYIFQRARGISHNAIFERFKQCVNDREHKCGHKLFDKGLKLQQESALNKKQLSVSKKSRNSSSPSSLQTLQTYCRVAGSLLRQPQRMTRVGQVLKEQISFQQNKHISHIERNFKKMVNPPPKNLRIANI
ncbi:hypothetical protein CU098_005821 [Rhizopus stolonifer]|uniref:BZIP domain-containing protein n=1 Tax=Rhizopus stolonifer TaxID=4846 RepID=A0A367JLJ8_RHIST|nr:hypothetical protein CU098_005821 [Rhizopus stolonifer]